MFLRVLIWVLLIGVVWWFVRKRWRDISAPPPASPSPPPPAARIAEPMVDCANCGVHLPGSEAVRDDAQRPYCCVAHRDAGPRIAG